MQTHVSDGQRSTHRPIIDGHVAHQRGMHLNSADVNFFSPMGIGHVDQQYGNLIGNADWAGIHPMGFQHVANMYENYLAGWNHLYGSGHVAGQPGIFGYNYMGKPISNGHVDGQHFNGDTAHNSHLAQPMATRQLSDQGVNSLLAGPPNSVVYTGFEHVSGHTGQTAGNESRPSNMYSVNPTASLQPPNPNIPVRNPLKSFAAAIAGTAPLPHLCPDSEFTVDPSSLRWVSSPAA